MEVFVKVVEAGNLSRAAENLRMANASVTNWIRNLESHLGVTLLHRSTRHMKLTEEGATYYKECREILARVEEIENSTIMGRTAVRGTLRVDMPIAIGHQILGPSLVAFAKRHPDLNTVVNLTNSVDDLIHRGIDVAIRMDAVHDGDLVARWIFEDRHVVCAAPQFLVGQDIPKHPAAIAPRDCMGYITTASTKPRPWVMRSGSEEFNIEPAHNLSFNSSDALLQSACRGGGYVYVLHVLAKDFLKRGDLVSVLDDWEMETQTFYAVYPQSRFVAPKVRTFIEFLQRDVFETEPTSASRTIPQLVARRHA
ncbi:LysR family transcriptional regulator [Bosea sp. (in: a-proteobacteria)]|uniref:LysR family transcriptional regulator n=1 Tax=Bosea sp. (in: a-proteobacteria) TaxID=1871050 RepID=UPI00260519DC|nr:LysR family transcriptional regulator [Bosea sp. (in: a-proteobacteria)]MCO5090939.1 LysR family transcriptional regulator [Bosea sp. (in: a-proteobacteria)]